MGASTSSFNAVAFVLACTLSGPAAAQLGGNPNDAFSCYSDCGGPSPASGTPSCHCDETCNQRGDCCADRDEWCGPKTVAPACSLTTNTHSSEFCGTDLGFVFQHGTGASAKLEVLFGDSWEWWDAFSCTTRGLLGISDDAQGWMPVSRPASLPLSAAAIPATGISDCAASMLNMDVGLSLFNPPANTYTSIRLWPATGSIELELPPGSTPTAGWSDGVNVWALFKQGTPEPGSTLLGVRDSTVRTNYRVRQNLGSNANYKFFNPSVTRITSLDATNPKLSNFNLPSGTDAGIVLFFGRPRFWSTNAQSSTTNGLYLMRQDTRLNATGASGWKPVYLKTLDGNENPTWSNPHDADGANDLDEAQPMITTDFKAVNQMDVKWVPELGKWVMLYGGDVHWNTPPPTNDQPRHGAIHMRMASFPWGPWTRPTPLLWRESMRGYFECDATPTTTPAGCDPSTYDVGTWKASVPKTIAGCTTALPEPVQPNSLTTLTDCYDFWGFPNYNQRGLLYSPEIVPGWTRDGAVNAATRMKTVTIYFLVSTWMPYQVVLAAADLVVPVNNYNTPAVVQLRDLNNKLVKMGTTAVSTQVGTASTQKTSWRVERTTSPQPASPLRLGDEVYLRSMNDGGATYLANSGDTVTFTTVSGTPPNTVKWRLDTTDAARYPVGMAIELGKTPIILTNFLSTPPTGVPPSTAPRLKSQSGTLRNLTGASTDAVWKLSWACTSGDVCQ